MQRLIRAKIEAEAGEGPSKKTWKVGIKEQLLLIEALSELPVSLSFTKLVEKLR